MKNGALLSLVGILAMTHQPADAGLFSSLKKEPLPKELKVRTTAYTHTEADHLQYGKKTAAGGTLQYTKKYTSAAADWSKFPLGTKFKIDGIKTTFVVDDYGSALVGSETIDIYHPSKSAMNNWGVKHVDITILEYGCFESSREILEQRTKYSHVRKMLAGINKSPGPKTQEIKAPPSPPKPVAPPIPAPPFPAAPAVDETPEIQLAWAATPPAPKPAPPTKAATSSQIPKADLPVEVASHSTPTPVSPAPTPAESMPPRPETTPVPTVVTAPPAPRARKFAPLSLAGFSAPTTPQPAVTNRPESSTASDLTRQPQPNSEVSAPSRASSPATGQGPKFKKREFRPLMASVNS